MQATYSPEDNKLRLYSHTRLDSETYAKVKAAGFRWAPKQELFIHGAFSSIRPAVAIGVGAGFDFIAERMRRAPRWMSKSGMEWLFRLAQEPRRLAKRYLVDDPEFLAILYRTMRTPKSERVSVAT